MGMIAPGRTPSTVVAKIRAEVVEALETAAIRDKLAAQLMEPIGNTPAEFRARIEGEIARWAPVIRAANVKVN
jgi:tripartite-type tricarboxylate transporter receptor subunit TctC